MDWSEGPYGAGYTLRCEELDHDEPFADEQADFYAGDHYYLRRDIDLFVQGYRAAELEKGGF